MRAVSGPKVAVVGLGYVGLPLAVAFASSYPTIGYDIDSSRVRALQANRDSTLEMSEEELRETELVVTDHLSDIRACNVYIVTAPTPVNAEKQPDLSPLLGATRTVAGVLKRGDTVIYESTVYPGATEERCIPLLEELSGLAFNEGFWVGYSPERINPGDKEHRVTDILKVTSGSTPEAADFVDRLYSSVIEAGTYQAPSIKVAEAAKVIENTQRDVNIALMNELAILFGKLGIDTEDVLLAAGSKWNFLPFRPGLVGGHCIGVDPYYLTHKAQSIGYHPEIILAGRRLNDSMAAYAVSQLIKSMLSRGITVKGARALVLGLTFKENTPDLRNSKVVDVVRELKEYGLEVDVNDPLADEAEAREEYGIELIKSPGRGEYDAIILAVAHDQYREMGSRVIRGHAKSDASVLYDMKYMFPSGQSDLRL